MRSRSRSSRLIDCFFPRRCFACRKLHGDSDLCKSCEEEWPVLTRSRCTLCASPFENQEAPSHLCGECLSQRRYCQKVHAAGVYRGLLLEVIARLKYRGEESMAGYLGQRMAGLLLQEGCLFDCILPIPLHVNRLRERGYNQALLLAREIGFHLKIKTDPFVMVKKKSTVSQALLKGEERRKNLRETFFIKNPEKIRNSRVLLVDDVYTTGATIEAASQVLRDAGAAKVEALVVARAAHH